MPQELIGIMRCIKTVTPIKIYANRKNAKLSTGPRTARGKSIARFNAVTLGLFAKHIAIPICDGPKAERNFRTLIDGLHEEFQPKGFYEEWLVLKIAECMWRIRRATRCERGAVEQSAIFDDNDRLENRRSMEMYLETWALESAEKELRESGSLSLKNYQKVLPLVEEERERIQSEKLVEVNFNREEFLACISSRKETLESQQSLSTSTQGERSQARFDYTSLVPKDDMDRILRYEERMHRQIDWAMQRLLEAQDRRRTLQPLANTDAPRLAKV